MKNVLTRRRWLRTLALGVGAFAIMPKRVLSDVLTTASDFNSAEFAYISPKQSNGKESTCHGEVWFAWLDNRIVIVTGRDSWKYKALTKGLNEAYLWIGDYGRWKGWFGRRNTSFNTAPRRLAEATESRDPELLNRLLQQFAIKYPEEINDWEQEQRTGFHENRRTLIVYKLTQ